MSLTDRFVNQTLCVGLAPARLTCVLRRGENFVPDTAYSHDLGIDDVGWQPVLDALQSYLEKPDRPRQGLPMSVVLSSRWCHLATVPWSDALLRTGSATRFLQSHYTALYGESTQGWAFTMDDAPYGQPRLACGIETDLLRQLQQTVMRAKHRCEAIEPIASVAWRAVAAVQGVATNAVAVVESGWLALCHVVKGRIVSLQSQPCNDSWSMELPRAWKRWVLRQPDLAAAKHVAVINLTGEEMQQELPEFFQQAVLPPHRLPPGFDFVGCGRGQ